LRAVHFRVVIDAASLKLRSFVVHEERAGHFRVVIDAASLKR
jgi:hypothetical protein